MYCHGTTENLQELVFFFSNNLLAGDGICFHMILFFFLGGGGGGEGEECLFLTRRFCTGEVPVYTAWCSETGHLTLLDACNSGASSDVSWEPISRHQAVGQWLAKDIVVLFSLQTQTNQRRDEDHASLAWRLVSPPVISWSVFNTGKQSQHLTIVTSSWLTLRSITCSYLEVQAEILFHITFIFQKFLHAPIRSWLKKKKHVQNGQVAWRKPQPSWRRKLYQ